MQFDFDVMVVGAGPAGSTAARRLASAGMRTVLVDREIFPRFKVCGGGLIGKTLSFLPEGVLKGTEPQCRQVDMNLMRSGIGFTVVRDSPIITMVMRSVFDLALLEKSCAAGVDFRPGWPVKGLQVEKGRLSVSSDSGTLSARFVIAADGATGRLASLAGFADNRHSTPALEAEVEVSRDILDSYRGRARFDFEWIDDGYAWVFPKQNHLSIGLLSMSRRAAGLHALLDDYLEALGIPNVGMQKSGYVIPVRPRQPPHARNGVFLVGDSLGLADPLTAEGISAAIISGSLAAESLIGSGGDLARAESRYAREIQAHLLGELAWSRRLARIMYFRPNLRKWVFKKAGQSLCEKLTDCIMGHASIAREFRHPGNWLKLMGRIF